MNTYSLDELSQYFHLPINEVAKELGVCATVLKKICRKNGIKRWPHRKIKSLARMIETLQTITPSSPADSVALQAEINALEDKKAFLMRNPNVSYKTIVPKYCISACQSRLQKAQINGNVAVGVRPLVSDLPPLAPAPNGSRHSSKRSYSQAFDSDSEDDHSDDDMPGDDGVVPIPPRAAAAAAAASSSSYRSAAPQAAASSFSSIRASPYEEDAANILLAFSQPDEIRSQSQSQLQPPQHSAVVSAASKARSQLYTSSDAVACINSLPKLQLKPQQPQPASWAPTERNHHHHHHHHHSTRNHAAEIERDNDAYLPRSKRQRTSSFDSTAAPVAPALSLPPLVDYRQQSRCAEPTKLPFSASQTQPPSLPSLPPLTEHLGRANTHSVPTLHSSPFSSPFSSPPHSPPPATSRYSPANNSNNNSSSSNNNASSPSSAPTQSSKPSPFEVPTTLFSREVPQFLYQSPFSPYGSVGGSNSRASLPPMHLGSGSTDASPSSAAHYVRPIAPRTIPLRSAGSSPVHQSTAPVLPALAPVTGMPSPLTGSPKRAYQDCLFQFNVRSKAR